MKALIWKFRFARFIRRKGGMRWRFAWQNATSLHPDLGEWSPIDAAREEMSHWEP